MMAQATRPIRYTGGGPAWVRPWLYAAAIYNAAWGLGMVIAPSEMLRIVSIPNPPDPLPWRVVGMMVLTYAPAYWWSARHLRMARPFVGVAVLGKALGLTGFLASAAQGSIPWSFGAMILANDVVWLPAFLALLVTSDGPVIGQRSYHDASASAAASIASPYAPILMPHIARVPTAFSEQFLRVPGESVLSVVAGDMDRVWWRPRILTPVFAVLGRLGILVPHAGTNVAMSLTLRPGIDAHGQAYQVCDRAFDLPGARFVTRKTFEPRLGVITESVGPGGVLQVAWDTRFRAPRALTFRQIGMGLMIRGHRIWLSRPVWRWLFGTTRFVQLVDRDDGELLLIRMVLDHPLVGRCFGYSGSCRLYWQVRTEQPTQAPLPWSALSSGDGRPSNACRSAERRNASERCRDAGPRGGAASEDGRRR
jgi:hypothetical protein